MENEFIKMLTLLYGVNIAANMPSLLSKQFTKELHSNPYLKHSMLLILIYLVIISANKGDKYGMPFALIVYLWFVFSTKMTLVQNLVFIFTLFAYYIYNNRSNNEMIQIINDDNIDTEVKYKLMHKATYTRLITIIPFIILIAICVHSYWNYQVRNHIMGGGNASALQFFLN